MTDKKITTQEINHSIPIEEIARRMIIIEDSNASFSLEGFTALPRILELQKMWIYGYITMQELVSLGDAYIDKKLAELDERKKIFDLEHTELES